VYRYLVDWAQLVQSGMTPRAHEFPFSDDIQVAGGLLKYHSEVTAINSYKISFTYQVRWNTVKNLARIITRVAAGCVTTGCLSWLINWLMVVGWMSHSSECEWIYSIPWIWDSYSPEPCKHPLQPWLRSFTYPLKSFVCSYHLHPGMVRSMDWYMMIREEIEQWWSRCQM
jgi:hypothetical protein